MITESGKKVLDRMVKFYGKEKGKEIFYKMIEEKAKGSQKWEKVIKKK